MSGFQARFEQRKTNIAVLILGPYGECEKDLVSLKSHLVSQGFVNTKLVSDFPNGHYIDATQDAYFLVKSKHYIENWADVLLFIVDEKCNNDSVLAELFIMVSSVSHKCHVSTVLCSGERHLGSLLRGTLTIHRINLYEFNSVQDFEKKGYAAVFHSAQKILYHC